MEPAPEQAGTVLAAADDSAGLESRDYEIQMKKNMSTSRMLIWDFAAEDGDVVTVKVDGRVLATAQVFFTSRSCSIFPSLA
ncbi:hypothetical protein NNL21_21450 [Paenibacillus mendelii]|nr:hypothetical protein [Paenibacillus mendelii]